ncbi:MAG: hypothetical protein ACFFD7_09850, partial [Candidatus Thorarchaeota archaeon]
LMEPMPNFSICYLFKGQTFLAAQRLAKFAERIQNTKDIWETLEKYHKACQVLELKTTPLLKSLITEIFKEKSNESNP